MYTQIKQLADEALALQNKDRMDAALREISALCHPAAANKAMVEKVAAEVGGEVKTYGEAEILAEVTPDETAKPKTTSIQDHTATIAAVNSAIKSVAKKGGAK